MASDFAANLIRTIVEQRSQLVGESKQSVETFLESATQQAKHILLYGLNIAVHVSLAPLKCQCTSRETGCKQAVEFEVWTICVDKKLDNNDPTILPIFLQQAILSQLHFSSFNAWLSDNHNGRLPKGFKCVYRLSTNPEFETPTSTKSHSFPYCLIEKNSDEQLRIKVEWMSKFVELHECTELKKPTNNNDSIASTNLIDDCPIERNITEKTALQSFAVSSLSKYPHLLLEKDKKKRIRRNTTGSETTRETYNGSPVPWNQSKMPNQSPKSGLLSSFEESVLKGRLHPINSLDGFKLQMIIQDRFNTSPVELPITTYFFNVSDDHTPSLYLGHSSIKPIRISKHSTIQATIFNPQGSVVKIFIVSIRVNIPPCSKTFVRQRTYSMPKTLPIEEAKRSWLRYLINFPLVTDDKNRLFMHTEIKMLFANKLDLDVQNLVARQDGEFQLITSTEEPGYSTIK